MILYDDRRKEGLIEFGIEIPILLSRVLNTFEFLKSHAVLGPKIDQWHVCKIEETIGRDDLLRAHPPDWKMKLSTPSN